MIKTISLTNWKTHKETKLEFTKGTNVLIGIVGAGKSSVMDAISFGLFGTFPILNAKKLTLDEVIMSLPNEMEETKIAIEFAYKQDNYKVERTIYRGKKINEAKLYKNEKFYIGPKPSNVTQKIEEILEINFDLFSRAVYSEQNQIDYFLKLSPSQRKQKFDELLDLKKYETARSNAVIITNKIKKSIDEKNKWVQELNTKSNKQEIENTRKKIEEKNKETESIKKKQTLNEEETLELIKQTESMQKTAEENKNLREIQIKSKGREEELKKTIKKLEEEIQEKIERYDIQLAEKMLQELEMKQKMLKEQEDKIKEMQRSINSLKESKNFLEKQLTEKQKNLPAKNLEELNKKIKQLLVEKIEKTKTLEKNQKELEIQTTKQSNTKTAKEIMENKLKETEQSLKQLQIHSECPICETKLVEEKKKEIQKNKEAIKNKCQEEEKILTKLIREHETLIKEKQTKAQELIEKIAKLEKQKIELSQKTQIFSETTMLKQKIDSTQRDIETKQSIAKIAQEGFNQEAGKELQKEQKRFEKIIEGIGKTEELKAVKKLLEEIQEKIEKLNFNQEFFEKLKELQVKKIAEKESIKKELASLQELINQMKKNIEGFEALKKQQQTLEEEINSMKALQEKMSMFTNALKASQTELREILIDTVNKAMDDIWPRIYPYKDLISAKIEIQENGDYELKAKQNNGKWKRVEGILSGGERSSAAICIRIAFSLVLTQNLSWLILDEPTHNLDTKSVKELSQMMKEHLPELVEQIFVITHDNEMEKAASGTLYMLERNKEIQGTTNAIQIKN